MQQNTIVHYGIMTIQAAELRISNMSYLSYIAAWQAFRGFGVSPGPKYYAQYVCANIFKNQNADVASFAFFETLEYC